EVGYLDGLDPGLGVVCHRSAADAGVHLPLRAFAGREIPHGHADVAGVRPGLRRDLVAGEVVVAVGQHDVCGDPLAVAQHAQLHLGAGRRVGDAQAELVTVDDRLAVQIHDDVVALQSGPLRRRAL